MIKTIWIISVAFFALFSCKSTPPAASTPRNFVVKFTSSGNGFDFDTQQKFDQFLKDQYAQLKYETYGYGRDNGREYCITSEGMKAKQFNTFIKDAKVILDTSDRVVTKEDGTCLNKK